MYDKNKINVWINDAGMWSLDHDEFKRELLFALN